MLTFDQILAADDLETQTVLVPEWGGEVKVKAFSKAQQSAMRLAATVKSVKDGKVVEELDNTKLEAAMLACGLAVPTITLEQAEQLQQKSAGVVDRILKAIMVVAKLTPEAVKDEEKSAGA